MDSARLESSFIRNRSNEVLCCKKCGCPIMKENNPVKNGDYYGRHYCPDCDENMFEFETTYIHPSSPKFHPKWFYIKSFENKYKCSFDDLSSEAVTVLKKRVIRQFSDKLMPVKDLPYIAKIVRHCTLYPAIEYMRVVDIYAKKENGKLLCKYNDEDTPHYTVGILTQPLFRIGIVNRGADLRIDCAGYQPTWRNIDNIYVNPICAITNSYNHSILNDTCRITENDLAGMKYYATSVIRESLPFSRGLKFFTDEVERMFGVKCYESKNLLCQ